MKGAVVKKWDTVVRLPNVEHPVRFGDTSFSEDGGTLTVWARADLESNTDNPPVAIFSPGAWVHVKREVAEGD